MAVFAGSLVGAWSTFDFWGTVPMVPCVLAAGVLAGLALYVRRGGSLGPMLLALGVALITFFGTLAVTLGRWEG
ncbi:MAG TPA: hypothetical protein VF101_14435 [Gaiellaceae bacterium]